MALNKLALGLIAGVASVGVIGGVAAAVVTSNNSTVINPEDRKPGETETGMETDSGKNPDQNNPTINLEETLKKFSASDITLTMNVMVKDTYAFNVKKEQLNLTEEAKKKIPDGVEVVIESINNTNNGDLLNQGKLGVNLKASFKEKPEQESKTQTVVLEGFKAASEVLRNYLKPTTDDTHTSVLNLFKPSNDTKSAPLVSVEKLNEVTTVSSRRIRSVTPGKEAQQQTTTGLNTLFQTINKPKEDSDESIAEKLKTITVEGTVKLTKITKGENDISLFHLVSADSTKPLKLIENKSDSEKSEALVDEVVVTNLLASNIQLNFKGYEKSEQAAFLKKYEDAVSSSMFTFQKEKGFSFKVKKDSTGSDEIDVSFKPVFIKRIAKEQDLETNLVISFGTGTTAKTYSTSESKDLEELKNSEISFSVYSQKLTEKTETVKATEVNKEAFKLGTYLNKDSIATGVATTGLEEMDSKTMKQKPIGGFSLISLSGDSFKTDFSIGQAKTVMQNEVSKSGQDGSLDTFQETWLSENWISFVGYSFKAELDKKVLFIPTINLVHVAENKMPPKAELPGPSK